MRRALEARGAWVVLKQRCAGALLALRRHSSLLTLLARAALRRLLPDEHVQSCLAAAFFLAKTEAELPAALSSYIELSVYSPKKYLKNTFHNANLSRLVNK